MRHGVAERAVMAAALRGKYARLLRCVRQIPAARVVFRKKCRNERIARAQRVHHVCTHTLLPVLTPLLQQIRTAHAHRHHDRARSGVQRSAGQRPHLFLAGGAAGKKANRSSGQSWAMFTRSYSPEKSRESGTRRLMAGW